MAFQEFYVETTGSNLNGGSTPGPAKLVLTGRDWDGTSLLTCQDGDDLSGIAVGDFASILVDGASGDTPFIARVTAIDNTAPGKSITVSTTARCGTPPTSGTGTRTIRVGGAWAGPNGSSGFPFSFLTGAAVDASSNFPRANIRSGTDYTITAGITRNVAGPVVFQGYTTTPGDGGKATIRNTHTSSITMILLSSAGVLTRLADLILDGGGAALTGANSGVSVAAARCSLSRITVRNQNGYGFRLQNNAAYPGILVTECEVHTLGVNGYGYWAEGIGLTVFNRCIAHGVAFGYVLSGSGMATRCIADRCTSIGYDLTGDVAILQHCEAHNTQGTGHGFRSSVGSTNRSHFLENCNAVLNAGNGLHVTGASAASCIILVRNCGHYGNSAGWVGGTTTGILELGTIAYSSTPYTNAGTSAAPRAGNFCLTGQALQAGRIAFQQDPTVYSSAIGTCAVDLGAAERASTGATGGIPASRVLGEL
jgi:hypothetical protein